MTQPDWQALYLYEDGALVPVTAEIVPTAFSVGRDEIVAAGKICPLLQSHSSTLLPGAAIKPHSDLWILSIDLHFAIDTPRGLRDPRRWRDTPVGGGPLPAVRLLLRAHGVEPR